MWKQIVSSYFSFTKKERTGIFVLLFLILLFILLPFLYPFFSRKSTANADDFKKEIAALKIQEQDTANRYVRRNYNEDNEQPYNQPSEKNYYNKTAKGELFYFDPNTASAVDWQRLGVREKTIATIQNYLAKGGHFYKPEDIGKIWGLHPDEVQRLQPYVQIAARENTIPAKNYSNTPFEKNKNSFSIIDINATDTSALIALPGIGSKLAQRILNFRDKLGGFYKVEQVAETFGLPDSTFQKIKPRLSAGSSKVKQININTATLDEMKAHPYLRYNLANAIVQYRNLHGNFLSVEDIKKIMTVTDDIYNKVAAYLTVQ